MTNLQKRVITSIIIFPICIFFILKGGNYIVSFLYAILILGNFEVFSVFKRKLSIIFLDLVLVSALLSILFLRNDTISSYVLLIWVIILTIFSDIGGYIFGKLFKWGKLTDISPRKTLSGSIGSFIFSIGSVFIIGLIFQIFSNLDFNFFKVRYFVLAIVLSFIAQLGDIAISYLKRLEKIKDTGKILPGHGGIFDRIDGLMFTILFATLIYRLGLFP